MIIGSTVPPPSTWTFLSYFRENEENLVIPQSPANLSDEDKQVLEGLGLPPEKWDNLNALMALYNKSEENDVFSVQVSKPGMELSRSYILEQIEFFLKNFAKKGGG